MNLTLSARQEWSQPAAPAENTGDRAPAARPARFPLPFAKGPDSVACRGPSAGKVSADIA